MMAYDVYIMEHGKNYYKKFHLRGCEDKFDDLHVILSFYKKEGIIDKFYMFLLSPEYADEAVDA
jgi:hypothetical protein